jgi:hypothetical protein
MSQTFPEVGGIDFNKLGTVYGKPVPKDKEYIGGPKKDPSVGIYFYTGSAWLGGLCTFGIIGAVKSVTRYGVLNSNYKVLISTLLNGSSKTGVTFANGFALTAFFYSSFGSIADFFGLDHRLNTSIATPTFAGFSTGLMMLSPLGIKTRIVGSVAFAATASGISHYVHSNSYQPNRNTNVVRGKAKF